MKRNMSRKIRKKKGEIRALLGYFAASSGNSLPTFRDILSVPSSRVNNPWNPRRFLALEDGTDTYRNVDRELPPLAA
jgi:hypothetical protein